MSAQRGHFERPVSAEPTTADRERAEHIVANWAVNFSPDETAPLVAMVETYLAAAREEGRQEGERIRATVEALLRDENVTGFVPAHLLRAAVAPAQPAEGSQRFRRPDGEWISNYEYEHPAQPVTRTTPEEQP